jgi:NAD(P)-dependent dehydrogenase (short-subunit alcohol dehydrogenase family)
VIAVRSDVSDLADPDRLFAEVKDRAGKLDVLFANAGAGSLAPLGSISEERWFRHSASDVAVRLVTIPIVRVKTRSQVVQKLFIVFPVVV